MFFSLEALGQAADQAAKQPTVFETALPIIIMLGIFYFFLIRPQAKKARAHEDLIKGLKAGDEVVTTGGLIGRIKSIAETFVTVEVSQNTSIKVIKSHVTALTKAKAATPAPIGKK